MVSGQSLVSLLVDAAKAQAFGEAIFERSRMIMRMMNIPDFEETNIELLGDNSQYSIKYQMKIIVRLF